MTDYEIEHLASAWVEYRLAAEGSETLARFSWSWDKIYDLLFEERDPDSLWKTILAIHRLDKSIPIQQTLSAGPVEDLLGNYGEKFIDLVEAEARRDPSFARMLGGIWQGGMSDPVWERLQAVWDRRGWDGIPE